MNTINEIVETSKSSKEITERLSQFEAQTKIAHAKDSVAKVKKLASEQTKIEALESVEAALSLASTLFDRAIETNF